MIAGFFIYIYVFLGLLVLFFDASKQPEKVYNKVFNIVYIILGLLVALRYKVGPDTATYMVFFNEVPTIKDFSLDYFNFSRFQPLYVLLNSLCKTIYDNFVTIQILQAFLFFHSFYLLMRKLDLRKFYILFLFFGANYFAEMSGMRECFGLSFCMYGLLFYIEKKWISYYSLVFAGILCHSGMVIFLVLPLIKLFRSISILNIIIIGVVFIVLKPAFDYLQIFSILLNEGDSLLNYSFQEGGQLRMSTLLFIVMRLAVIVYFIFICSKDKYNDYSKDFIYLGIVYIFLGFFTESMPILYRFAAHFALFYFFCIKESLKCAKSAPIIVALMFVLFSYTSVMRFSSDMNEIPTVYNYCSVFSSDNSKAKMNSLSIEHAY